jgi:hypothetical protein
LMVRNLILHFPTERTTCSLLMIMTDKKQADMQWFIITVICVHSQLPLKWFYFTWESAPEEEVWFIFVQLIPPCYLSSELEEL